MYLKYSNGLRLFNIAVCARLYTIQLAVAPAGLFENSQFFLPITIGFTVCSARLLSSSSLAELIKLRNEMRKDELMAAVIKSEHSYEEIMAFIKGGSSEDE